MTQQFYYWAYTLRKPQFNKAAVLFTIARTWKKPRYPSTDEWIKELWYIYPMGYYLAIKRKECESIELRWMNLESVIQNEVSQKEKNIIY